MTKDELNNLMKEAGPIVRMPFDQWCERFAALVAAHKAEVALAEAYRCGYEAGVLAEREACADIVENAYTPDCGGWTAQGIADDIRARGTT